MKLNSAKTTAVLDIQGEYDARRVEALLIELAELRSQMEPSTAASHRDPDNIEGLDKRLSIEEDAAVVAAKLPDGRIRLWMQHRGYGWIGYTLSMQHAFAVMNYLDTFLPEKEPGADLFGEGDGQTH